MSIAPETLAWLRQTAKFEGGVTAQAILHLLERLETLEQWLTRGDFVQVPPAPEAVQPAPSTEFAADKVIIHCPETCWVEVRRVADGKVLYDNFRRGSLVIPVGKPPAEPPAPPGGLVERVGEAMERHHVIGDIEGSWDAQARAAIREVAEWLDQRGMHGCSLWLLEEVDRG
jgi:hypothetical protein